MDGKKLIEMNRKADQWVIQDYFNETNYLPLSFETADNYNMITFKSIESIEKESWITGSIE